MNIIKFCLLALPLLLIAGFVLFAVIDVPVAQETVQIEVPADKIFNEE